MASARNNDAGNKRVSIESNTKASTQYVDPKMPVGYVCVLGLLTAMSDVRLLQRWRIFTGPERMLPRQ
jgi:hypothetical protein